MLAVLAVIAAAVLFGTTGTSQAVGPADTTPLAVGTMRLLAGGTALALVGFGFGLRARRRAQNPPRYTRGSLGLMALTGASLAAYQPLFFLGTERNGVAVGTVVAIGSVPVIAGVIEWGLTRRLPSATWAAATVLALAGVSLLIFGGDAGSSGADPVGFAGSVGAGGAFAVLANAQRRLLQDGWDPFTAAGAMGAGSAAVALMAAPSVDLRWVVSVEGLTMSLWLGLATIALAYCLFTGGLQRLTAATAGTLALAEPLTAAVLGIAVLGERLSGLAIAGLAVLASGLVLLAWGARRPRAAASTPVEA